MLPIFRHKTWILSATLLLASLALAAFADDELSLSLATEQLIDGVAAIDIDEPFRVVFTNNNEEEVRIWHPLSREGYYCLTFKSRSLATGEMFSTRKRRIDEDDYFKALGDHSEPSEVNIRNKSESTGTRGGTPLHSAAFWGRDKIAAMLVKAGADVNARGENGSTPLHSAARLSNITMAKLLLTNGAMIDAKDNDGETPLDWCRELNRTNAPEIEKIFREYSNRGGAP